QPLAAALCAQALAVLAWLRMGKQNNFGRYYPLANSIFGTVIFIVSAQFTLDRGASLMLLHAAVLVLGAIAFRSTITHWMAVGLLAITLTRIATGDETLLRQHGICFLILCQILAIF